MVLLKIIALYLVISPQMMAIFQWHIKIWNVSLFSLCFYCSPLFVNKRTIERTKQTKGSLYWYFYYCFGMNLLIQIVWPNFMPIASFSRKLWHVMFCTYFCWFQHFLGQNDVINPERIIGEVPNFACELTLWVYIIIWPALVYHIYPSPRKNRGGLPGPPPIPGVP